MCAKRKWLILVVTQIRLSGSMSAGDDGTRIRIRPHLNVPLRAATILTSSVCRTYLIAFPSD